MKIKFPYDMMNQKPVNMKQGGRSGMDLYVREKY
jgi:hypothetical protein